jgi:hypothetical protein
MRQAFAKEKYEELVALIKEGDGTKWKELDTLWHKQCQYVQQLEKEVSDAGWERDQRSSQRMGL